MAKLILTEKYGGDASDMGRHCQVGAWESDREKVREGRQFVADDLKGLNPERLLK